MAINTLSCSIAMIAALSCFVFLPAIGQAADIVRHDDPLMGCSIRLSGLIADGDATRLEALIDARDAETRGSDYENFFETFAYPTRRRICLDSPGGSFSEAVRLARVITEKVMGTAIPAGNTCDSACGVAFMAGTFFSQLGYAVPNRILHPQGRLGFHAPSLVLSGPIYTAEETSRAYDVALQTISEILELRLKIAYELQESLLLAMLRTPKEQMLRVETVGDAARWDIIVAPVAPPNHSLELSMFYVCLHAQRAANDEEPDAQFSWGSDLAATISFASSNSWDLTARFEYGFGLEEQGSCEIVAEIGDWFGLPTGPFGTSRVEANASDRFEYWYPFQTYASQTPLAQISPDHERLSEVFALQFRAALQRSK